MERRAHADRLTVTAAVITAAVGTAFAAMFVRGRPLTAYYDLFLFHNGPTALISAWLSGLVLRRHARNGAGRVLLAIGVLSAAHVTVATLADIRLVAAGYEAPLAGLVDEFAGFPFAAKVLVCFMNWLWVPIAVLTIAVLPLLFPDGAWPSRRWWPVPATAAVGGALVVAATIADAWPWMASATESPPAVPVLMLLGGPLVLGAAVGGLVALGVRWHRTEPERRRPFHVVGTTAAIVALALVALYPWQRVWIPASLLAIHALLSAYALAVARYRLHDIEPFLGRAAVAALLSGVIAAVYAAVVLGVGSLVGRPFDDPVLPVVALAAVALLMEPARRRARRLVDRWLFRAHADRTEVLSQVAAHASSSATAADVLSDVTELLLRSTGAARVEAWLATEHTTPAASAGRHEAADVTVFPILAVPVTHDGQRFGELRLYAHAHADLVADAEALVTDVAHTVGVVLRNDQLTAQLRAQLDELRTSRQRLVEAHDLGRRSLERDIHDGAQSRLIALRLRIGALRARYAGTDREFSAELDRLAEGVDGAVRALRDLARGLAPPLLEQSGLAPALRAHTRTLPISVSVVGDPPVRYAPTVESAAYFCCLEAIQNAIRHGAATKVSVTFDCEPTTLQFSVRDNGIGFDATRVAHGTGLVNISDRVAAFGGCSSIESHPGAGACVSASIPTGPLDQA